MLQDARHLHITQHHFHHESCPTSAQTRREAGPPDWRRPLVPEAVKHDIGQTARDVQAPHTRHLCETGAASGDNLGAIAGLSAKQQRVRLRELTCARVRGKSGQTVSSPQPRTTYLSRAVRVVRRCTRCTVRREGDITRGRSSQCGKRRGGKSPNRNRAKREG